MSAPEIRVVFDAAAASFVLVTTTPRSVAGLLVRGSLVLCNVDGLDIERAGAGGEGVAVGAAPGRELVRIDFDLPYLVGAQAAAGKRLLRRLHPLLMRLLQAGVELTPARPVGEAEPGDQVGRLGHVAKVAGDLDPSPEGSQ